VTPRNTAASLADASTGLPADAESTPSGARLAYRGRLFRKYLLLILSLVGGALLVSSAISLYFTYQENKSALADLQHEKALAAASRIEQYIRTIEQQLKYAALPQLDASDVELRRIEFLKLLRQAPEVTDIAQLDAMGREQIAVSRLGMDVAASGKDRSQEPAFREAKRGQTWFGPVYFRKETEPYMTMSIRSGGDNGPVTIADVNLKFIWDVVSRIKIGEKGKAYVVDRNGYLVADPDIGLVLRKTDLSQLAHVRAANAAEKSAALAMASTDLAGTQVLASVAPIAPLGWNVFVEQPIAEVYEKLNASIQRAGLLLLAGLVISAAVALALARSMVRPIRTLSEGAQRIGEGDLDQKIDVRTGDELEALGGQFNRMTSRLRESYAGLERKVEERTRELQNSLEQQTAISEILRVISSSPTNVQPVLDAVAERAAHLCDAPFARVLLIDGEMLNPMAEYSTVVSPPSRAVPLKRSSITGRAAIDRETIHHADIVPLLDSEFPDARENTQRLGCRAVLAVPLMREGAAYGGIFLYRREPGLFSPDQVAVVQTFAQQAAIAIDNVRLFNETKEALAQQTAISEILRVISSSPTDVRPMLNAVAERALKLCDATESGIFLVDGDALLFAAGYGTMLNFEEGDRLPLSRALVVGRATIDRQTIHHADIVPLLDTEYPYARVNQEKFGFRAILTVPLMREDRAIGAFTLWRSEPRAFTDKQIALVKTFADQAAIAIENVRLFNETKRALEQQTAISEILRVISASPTDVQPVLDVVAERAAQLCGAPFARAMLIDGETLRPVSDYSLKGEPLPPPLKPIPLARSVITGRAALNRETIHHADIVPLLETEYPDSKESILPLGARAVLAVPLMREGGAYGGIFLFRREPKLFTADQVALVETFARQAAIAIDNVRLFNETKEALEQQTAISEILRVISSSPTDVQPVFDIIGERAEKLCDAEVSVVSRVDGDVIRLASIHGVYADGVKALAAAFPMRIDAETVTARTIRSRAVQHVNDVLADPAYSHKELAKAAGWRASLGVPMLRDGSVIGAIFVGRRDPGYFSDSQVALLKTFADQAAIAIQNVRLFNETKEALEQQTAVAEILRVISSSPTDVQPVLDAIAERVAQLCDASSASMYLTDGDRLRHLASKGPAAEPVTHLESFPINRESISGQAILDRTTVHIADMLAVADQYPLSAELARRYGHRTVVVMPLFREGRPFGTIVLRRLDVRPFTDREVLLLRTFGDQAAIALENVRLFNETKEALEQQRASGDVLTAISSSIADTKPVFDVIVQGCQRLFAGHIVGITLVRDDGMLDVGANAGSGFDELKKLWPRPLDRNTASGQSILDREIKVYPDVENSDMPLTSRDGTRAIGTQSMVFAPMLFEGRAIGTLWVGRPFKGAFTDKQLTLLKTFADQAVIAIQNARLFNETNEALEQQRASGEVLAAISSSIADTSPVFDRILTSCERLFEGNLVQINLVGDDGLVRLGAYHGPARETIERIFPFPLDNTSATGTAILTRTVVHYPDVDHQPDVPALARKGWTVMGIKAVIAAPMLWEGSGIGAILVGRNHAGSFSDKEIALLKTFADQAVIAIQNARLFNETKEALDQQRASGEVLATISSSIADTAPVFDKILESCERLFVGTMVGINLVGEDNLIRLGAYHGPQRERLEKVFPTTVSEESGSGTAIVRRAVLHVPDVDADGVPPNVRKGGNATGIRSIIFAPMLWEGKGIGAIFVGRSTVGPFSEKDIALLKTFADQAVIAIQNARLFREIQDKSRQLEIANKHKSEFLANMSHELRTPLNAIIGFSEVLLERFFGEVNEKQDDYLKDIHSSGKHLLSLINDILDLSKVEAGRMELEPSSFDVASALSNALTLIRERAQTHGIALGQDVDPTLGEIVADERKLKQILLNLLSNAVKFTPDGGRIDVTARRVDGQTIISVRDTGVGIAAHDQAAVFEEFRQVGHDYTRKQEGTGLGLALTKKFVELHGGRIWLESEIGKGSTFTFTIPTRQ
jgi:GAF domain-containing protein/HAMP domain-containing protein